MALAQTHSGTSNPPLATMATVQRYVSVRIDASSRRIRNEDGALIVPGRLARTGIQHYSHGDGTVLAEYRPPDEVFDVESIASFDGLTATDLHPSGGLVAPTTYRNLSRGHIQNPRQEDGWLVVDFFIKDAEMIRSIEAGERTELSAGYLARLDMSPGYTPDGEKYDAVQRYIRGNHAALLPAGHARAGREARLLDSDHNEIIEISPKQGQETQAMDKFTVTVGGIEYALQGDATAQQALEKFAESTDKITADLERERARADEATQRADAADKALAAATDPAAIEAVANERAALIDAARKVSGDKSLDTTGSARDIMTRALAAVGVDLSEERSDDYVAARFDAKLENPEPNQGAPTVGAISDAIGSTPPAAPKPRFARLAAARDAAMRGKS